MNIKEYLNQSLPNKSKITNTGRGKYLHYNFFEKYNEREWIDLTMEMLNNSEKFPLNEEIGVKMYRKYTKYQYYGNLRRPDLQDLSIWILENWAEYLRHLYPDTYREVNLLMQQKPQRKIVFTPSTFDDLFEYSH